MAPPSNGIQPRAPGTMSFHVLAASPRQLVDRLAWVASSPMAMYSWMKLIDRLPTQGTFPIMGPRIHMMTDLHMRQQFYEPLSSYDSLLLAVRLQDRQRAALLCAEERDRLAVSFELYESANSAPRGVIPMPTTGDSRRGWHSVRVIAASASGDQLTFVNSWGPGWGDHGLGYLSREYLDRYLHEAWLMRNARFGLSPFSADSVFEATTAADLRRALLMENPRWTLRTRHGRQTVQLVLYEALSIEEACRGEVIELKTAHGFRLGWSMLFHVPGEPRSTVVKELFVWPPWRRQGYGSLIEEVAVERARVAGSKGIDVLFYEADAIPRSRAAGRLFAASRGYRWRWARSIRPSVAGVAHKDITTPDG